MPDDKKNLEILQQILANQVVIYKKLDKISNKIDGSARLASDKSYLDQLSKEAEKIKNLF